MRSVPWRGDLVAERAPSLASPLAVAGALAIGALVQLHLHWTRRKDGNDAAWEHWELELMGGSAGPAPRPKLHKSGEELVPQASGVCFVLWLAMKKSHQNGRRYRKGEG